MKLSRRDFLLLLGGTACLGGLGWMVNSKLQTPPAIAPEETFVPPDFAVMPKYSLNGVTFEVNRPQKLVIAKDEATGKTLWESNGEDNFIIPGAAFPIDLSPDGELWVANVGRKQLERLNPENGHFIASWKPSNPFGGCCNPVRFAALPRGRFVTMEKGVRRACIYLPSGELEQIITDKLSDSEYNFFLGRKDGVVHLYDTGTKTHWEVS